MIPLNIKNHILADFYAFEIQVVPYIIGHLRVAMSLEKVWDYEFEEDDRFQFYLTNTLEMKEPEQELLLQQLTEEGREAMYVKEKEPILVVLGNPPYSKISENKGDWILGLIEDYKIVDGKPLGEKNPKWLQDDYVKFIRFGQWKIDQSGEGILGFITNHSYLDNPTFRGMRQSLMKSFDEIYVLNLHGNSLKREKCPDGSKDENVFDIRPGVAIGLFIKRKDAGERPVKVFYADLWGLREVKYKWLQQNDRTTTEWQELKPKSPYYFFVPIKGTYWDEYEEYWKITDIMPTYSAGIVTARDKLTVHDSPEEVWKTVLDFSALPEDKARSEYNLRKDARDWKVPLAQDDLKSSGLKQELIVPVLYRPFDTKYTYYTGRSRGFICMPRPGVMPHMMHENLGLLYTRPQSPKYEFSVMVSAEMIDQCSIGNKSAGAGISYIAPLYLYPNKTTRKLTGEKTSAPEYTPNFSTQFLQAMNAALGTEPTPEEIFYYIYAVLYSPTYRKRYEEFLKIDFPRVPLPHDYEKFKNLSELGKELVELHLLKHPSLSETEIGFPVSGSNTVEKVRYDEETRRVYFNKEQYFEGVSKAVWEYRIGAYQVAEKYLKDRKKRELSLEEIEHYSRVAKAIERTIEVQGEVEKVYAELEGARNL
jgi:predicted helicase